MALIGVSGEHKKVTRSIIEWALEQSPSLIIDCTNAANAYLYQAQPEQFANTYVLEAESLYRFRPTIHLLPRLVAAIESRTIAITPYYHLFDFGNDQEQDIIIRQCWKYLQDIKEHHQILIGIKNDELHQELAQKCDKIITVD